MRFEDVLEKFDYTKMNINRLNVCIKMLETVDVKNFNMGVWVVESDDNHCGTVACFGGHLAQNAEFQAAGGIMLEGGIPQFNGQTGEDAFDAFVGMEYRGAKGLGGHIMYQMSGLYSNAIGRSVKLPDVLERLVYIKELAVQAQAA